MTELTQLLRAATAAADAAQLAFGADKSTVTTRTGRVARWIGNIKKKENREISGRFLAGLRETYGGQIAADLVERFGIGRLAATGRPLQARFVREVVTQAESLKIKIRQHNASIADICAALPRSKSQSSLLRSQIDEAARELGPLSPDVIEQIDMGAVSREVEGAILETGRKPDRMIDISAAGRTARKVVHRTVNRALARSTDAEVRSQNPQPQAPICANTGVPAAIGPSAGVKNPEAAGDARASGSKVSPYVSDLKSRVDRALNGSAYRCLPGGQILTEEVGRNIDLTPAIIAWVETDVRNDSRSAGGAGDDALFDEADALASATVRDAENTVFLNGYGVRTTLGQHHHVLQQVFDRHPMVQELGGHWGTKIDASALSQRTLVRFSDRLSAALSDSLARPRELPGRVEQVKQRVEQEISRVADDMVGEFIMERTDELIRLLQHRPEAEFPPALAQIVLQVSTPAEKMVGLLSLGPRALGHMARTISERGLHTAAIR
ncbi:MAG: hypothetical protein OXE40_14570 [Gammaproteobacteria bacterium]|nr:hypothetical protein [Gammaproteobacteria bacterium]